MVYNLEGKFTMFRIKRSIKGLRICSPEIHVPLNEELLNSDPVTWSIVNFMPGLKGPSQGGDKSTIKNRIKARTATITSKAIQMPLQFLSFGAIETNSCKQKTEKLIKVPTFLFSTRPLTPVNGGFPSQFPCVRIKIRRRQPDGKGI